MKKTGIINRYLCKAIAELGHTDAVAIIDCGYPIPSDCSLIDLSLEKGFPGFIDVLSRILGEIVVERALIAEEIRSNNASMHSKLTHLLCDLPVCYTSHEEFKNLAKRARFFIRTGEATPYSNILLFSGVDF